MQIEIKNSTGFGKNTEIFIDGVKLPHVLAIRLQITPDAFCTLEIDRICTNDQGEIMVSASGVQKTTDTYISLGELTFIGAIKGS